MTPRVAILDYGCGNLRSVVNAVREVGGEPIIVSDCEFDAASHVILPGQGHFGEAMKHLYLDSRPPEQPTLGICLGMQLMCEGSEEAPGVKGLGWFPYQVVKMPIKRLPHIGWSRVIKSMDGDSEDYYFCHSYAVPAVARATHLPDPTTGQWIGTEDGWPFAAVLFQPNLWAVQFHPEKSGKAGLELLRQFLAL